MIGKKTVISENDASDIRAMADAFVPALDDDADERSEHGDRYGSRLMRELAFVWSEIGLHVKSGRSSLDKKHDV